MFQIVVGTPLPTWLRWLLSIAGSVLLLVSVALPIWQGSREATARRTAEQLASEAERQHNVKIHDILIPLSALLTDVVSAPNARERRDRQERIKQAVIDAVSENIGPDRTRSCLYELDAGASPRKLVCKGLWKGRNDAPRAEFVDSPSDLAGQEAFRILDKRGSHLVPNVGQAPPPGWPHEGRPYKTYIQTAVAAGSKSFGILAVDALEPGDLKKDDQLLMSLLGQLLGCALAVGQ